MEKYIIIILIFLVLFYLYYCIMSIENFEDTSDWSSRWTALDFEARKNDNCIPIKKEYKKFGKIESWLWTMDTSCENGLPHTRAADIIAMPDGFSPARFPKTIEHEKIHLYQRSNSKDWINFYKKYWNYEIFQKPPSSMPEELIKMKRANPDTNDAPFACWNGKWWSVPVYLSSSDLKFRDCLVKWWNQETNKIHSDPPTEWITFFGQKVSQAEHPHEISAVYIANMLYNEYDETIKGMNILNKKWDRINERLLN